MQPARIGPYLVERELGRGGAGIVYLATDPKLDRQVAIKALPLEVAADPETLRRFEREAKTVAALNQRNIAAIYDIETVGDTRYLILEYVDGESVDRLLERGPLSIADALDCARQVADGLEAAHEKGIVHRDLKPANLRRRVDGVVKILDFGLAKAVGNEASDDSLLNITSESAIVGTPAYLSPEQAQGRSVDRRTDVWGFGCTLFELLTARKAFAANTLADLLRRILEEEPDYGALPLRTPPRVRELLERCLVKDPRERLRDVGDARIELERAIAERAWTGPITAAVRAPVRRGRRWWTYAATFILGASGYALWSGGAEPEATPRHVTIHVSGTGSDRRTVARGDPAFRISPDGSTVAFVAESDGAIGSESRMPRLFVRRLDSFEARAVERSENLMSFAFSPDSAWLCMVVPVSTENSAPQLVKVRVDGGAPPVPLAPWVNTRVLWLTDGTIIGSVEPASTFRRVAAAGGAAEDVPVTLEGVEPAYKFELLRQLPGGRGVTISIPTYGARGYELHLGILQPGAARARLLLRDAGAGAWDRRGHLLFTRRDRLLAVACDLPAGDVRGDPIVVADDLRTSTTWQHAWFDLAEDGTLLYQPGGVQGARRRLALVTADGQSSDWSGDRLAFDESVNVSLNGERLVVTRTGPGGLYEVWGSEIDPPRLRPLAVSPQSDCGFGVLSRDGDFLLFDRVGRDQPNGILRMPFDGSSPPRLVRARDQAAIMQVPMAIAPDDGAFLFWRELPGGSSLWLQSLHGGGEPEPTPVAVAEMSTSLRSGAFSPDGRWIVYISDITGRQTAYVRSFESATLGLGPAIPVPTRPDRPPEYAYWAKTLAPAPELLISHYRSWQRFDAVRLLSTDPVRFAAAEPRFHVGDERWVWDDVLPDGRILAIVRGPEEAAGDRLHLVTGWFAELAAALRPQPR